MFFTATFTPTTTPTATRTPSRTPTLSPHAVIINEIAWAGTKADGNDEWIELYNPGTVDVDLTGWHLRADFGAPRIDLGVGPLAVNHIIPAKKYFLLERTDDNTIRNIPADQIFTGALANTGETLRLIDADGALIDTANLNGGPWPAGDAKKHCSMERRYSTMSDSDLAWLTNDGKHTYGLDEDGKPICGSPTKTNWSIHVTPEPTLTATRTPTRKPTRTKTPTPAPITSSVLVINEFLAQPRSDWNHDGHVDSGDEFIEIKNLSIYGVSLSGWRLDDQDGDSTPYYLPAVTIQPGARLVFFGSETHILLGNGGDSVRLYKSYQLLDAFTYTLPPIPDQSWCRLPDGYGDFTQGCAPTPQEANKLATVTVVDNQVTESKLCASSTLLPELYQAECASSGLEMWSRAAWLEQLQSQFPLFIQQNDLLYIVE